MANSPANEGVWGMGLAPNEYKLTSCHEDKNIRIWDLEWFE